MVVPVLLYGGETIWRENEKHTIKAIQMGTLRDLLGIRRMERVPNAQIREMCGVMKGKDERIDGNDL